MSISSAASAHRVDALSSAKAVIPVNTETSSTSISMTLKLLFIRFIAVLLSFRLFSSSEHSIK